MSSLPESFECAETLPCNFYWFDHQIFQESSYNILSESNATLYILYVYCNYLEKLSVGVIEIMVLDADSFRSNNQSCSFQPASKRISQLIASSWLAPDADNPFVNKKNGEVMKILATGHSNDLKKLLEEAGVDLEATFGPTVLSSNWDSFFGTIREVLDVDGRDGIRLFLPYPPRPSKELVSDTDLEDWVNDDSLQSPYYPTHNYIPLSGT